MKRRTFLENVGTAGVATALGAPVAARAAPSDGKPFTIGLSQWGFHRAIFGDGRDNYAEFIKTLHASPDDVLRGEMDPRDIVVRARELDVDVVDLVNILWFGHAADAPWLRDFKSKAVDHNVTFGVLMCDQLPDIGSATQADRDASVAAHTLWMAAAAELGCSFLRVNPYGEGTYLQQCQRGAETLHRLAEISADYDLEILVENHGHPGGNAAWVAMLIEMVDHPRIGAYTDFDNFFMGGWGLDPERRYDRHQGMLDLAPYTKAVSAKSHDFGPDGEETTIDFHQCLQVVLDAGFNGLVTAEFEGNRLSEAEGSRLTVELLRREQARF